MRAVTGHYVNLISCGLYLGLILACWLFKLPSTFSLLHQVVLGLIIVGLFAFAFNLWRYLAIAKAPISSIQSAAQGYVELSGVASKQKTMQTPLHGLPCVWYRSWAYGRRDSQAPWRLVNYTQSDAVFQLTDKTGSCQVNPKGAEVIYMTKKTSEINNHRYVEQYLPANQTVYLIGYLDTRHHFSDEGEIRREVGELITSWKADPTRMLFRFDLDRNGEIDQEEWEKARAEARQEVEHRQMNLAHHGDFEIAKPSNGALYLISGKSPDMLRDSYRCWVITHVVVLFGLTIAVSLL